MQSNGPAQVDFGDGQRQVRELVDRLMSALRGGANLSPLIAEELIEALAKPDRVSAARLTRRQVDVLRLIAGGCRMKKIAAELNISTRTVETHKYEMMRNLGVRTTAELIRFAISHGIAAPG